MCTPEKVCFSVLQLQRQIGPWSCWMQGILDPDLTVFLASVLECFLASEPT